MPRVFALLALIAVAGCSPRAANPVSISQSGDDLLTCPELAAQAAANRAEALRLSGADDQTVNENVALGTVGVLVFWPALFALDLSNAEQIELRALQDRNETLAYLAQRKDC